MVRIFLSSMYDSCLGLILVVVVDEVVNLGIVQVVGACSLKSLNLSSSRKVHGWSEHNIVELHPPLTSSRKIIGSRTGNKYVVWSSSNTSVCFVQVVALVH